MGLEKRKHLAPTGIEAGTVRPVAILYKDYATWLNNTVFLPLWRCNPTRVMASSFLRFLDHTQRRTTVGRTPLDE